VIDPSIEIPEAIESPRLRIRATRPGDGPTVYAAVMETLPLLRAWPASLPWSLPEPSVDASEAFCRQGHENWRRRRDFPMLVFLKRDDEHVANVGLHRPDWSVPSIEVGYWCRAAHQGHGFTTEAVQALCGFAFDVLGVRRVTCLADEANDASRAVAARAGFALQAIRCRDTTGPDGVPLETRFCVYVRER